MANARREHGFALRGVRAYREAFVALPALRVRLAAVVVPVLPPAASASVAAASASVAAALASVAAAWVLIPVGAHLAPSLAAPERKLRFQEVEARVLCEVRISWIHLILYAHLQQLSSQPAEASNFMDLQRRED